MLLRLLWNGNSSSLLLLLRLCGLLSRRHVRRRHHHLLLCCHLMLLLLGTQGLIVRRLLRLLTFGVKEKLAHFGSALTQRLRSLFAGRVVADFEPDNCAEQMTKKKNKVRK